MPDTARTLPSGSYLAAAFVIAVSCALVLGVNAPRGFVMAMGFGGFVMATCAMVVGRMFCQLFRCPTWPALDFIAGLALLAHVLTVPSALFGTSLTVPTLAILAFCALCVLLRRRDFTQTHTRHELVGLVFAGVFALVWSTDTAMRYSAFPSSGVFPLALDAMMHSATISDFGDWRAFGRGTSTMSDVASGLYHFASYAYPALAVWWLDISPLDAVPLVWIALGTLPMVLGLYVLGTSLSGPVGGMLAVALLAALPDPAHYGFYQPFLSFHWLMEVAPGGLYALGTMGCAFALLVMWVRTRELGLLFASALMFALCFLLRVHFVLWGLLPWGFVVILAFARDFLPRKIVTGLIPALLISAPIVLLVISLQEISTNGLVAFLGDYLQQIHTQFVPNGYSAMQRWVFNQTGFAGVILPNVLIALLALGGVPLLAVATGMAMARKKLELFDSIPIVSLYWAGLLMILAPTPFHGDYSDFRQRGFVLTVLLLIAWMARFVLLVLPRLTHAYKSQMAFGVLSLLLCAVFVSSWKTPQMAYFQEFRTTAIPQGFVEAAAWLRKEAVPGGSFAVAKQDTETVATDDATLLLAMSGQPAYLSRAGLQLKANQPRQTAARHRLEVLASVSNAPDRATAMALLALEKVAFYVVTDTTAPRWDPNFTGADFRAANISIWRVLPRP